MIDAIANLNIAGIKGASAKEPAIENAPSPIALPKTYCAKADVNTYNDGMTK